MSGGVLVALGSLVLLGWALDIPWLRTPQRALISMKPNTALVFVLLGIHLWLGTDTRRRRTRQIITLCALLLTVANTFETVTGIDLGIDELLFRDPEASPATTHPGRMAPSTQLGFLLLTTGALLADAGRVRLAQILALITGELAFISLCGYLYGVSALYAIGPFNAIALYATIGLLVAAVGLLLACPSSGITAVFASGTGAGRLIRRMQPALIFIPLLLGAGAVFLQAHETIHPHFAVTLVVALNVALLGTLTWLVAAPLEREEVARARAEAERALAAEELMFTLRSIGDAVIATDETGRVQRMNPIAEQLTGWTLPEALGRGLDEVCPIANGLTREPLDASAVIGLEGGATARLSDDALLKRRHRAAIFVVGHAAPIRDADDAVHGLVLVFRDASRERAADRLFALSVDLMCVVGADGKFRRVNPAFESLLGFGSAEFVERPFMDWVHPDDATATLRAHSSFDGGAPIEGFENRFRCKDGTYRWLSWSSARDVGSRTVYAVGRDITVRKQAAADKQILTEINEFLPTVTRTDVLFEAITHKLGPYLGVSRCLFGEIDVATGRATVERDYAHGVASMSGVHDLARFGQGVLRAWQAGGPYIIEDAKTDPRTRAVYEIAIRPFASRAGVGIPIFRSGVLVGGLAAVSDVPRVWAPREIALLKAVVEQAWLWVEHVRVVQALRESEGLSRLLVDGAKDQAIFMLDPSGHIATWNRGAERLSGYASAEILGRPWSVLHVADDATEMHSRETLAQAEATGQFEAEDWRVRKDGTRFWAHVTISSLRDDLGVLRGFVHIARDISVRKQAEQDERWKAAVLNSAFDAIVTMDHRGIIREWNPAAERLLGHARQAVLGKSVADVMIPAPYRDAHRRALKRYLATGVPTILGSSRELEGQHADGSTCAMELSLVRLDGQTPPIFTAFMRDISVRKKLEADRQQLVTELRELNTDLEARVASRTAELEATLRERSVLLQEIHHRVKNNLQVIWSLINMQLRQISDDAARTALIDCQTRVSAIALVHQQLYRSRDFGRVPFSAYATALANAIVAANDVSRGRIALELQVEDIAITLDKAIPCGLILTELITNALKYAFPGGQRGTIRITLEQRASGEAVLSVGDDGVGLPATFDPATATSLGLQLVQALTEQLGGRLDIQRRAGTTTVVTFQADDLATAASPAP